MESETSKRGYIVPIGGAEERVRDPAILRRFVDFCGGPAARIVIIPTASKLRETGREYEKLFKDLGAREARSLAFQERSDCHRESWLEVLKSADGVFLTGGNQLRLSTTLGGTPVAEMLRDRNRQGFLHIAGTSAGAAIMSQHMIAFGDEGATPHTDMVTLAPGLGIVEDLIVDQHFRQRDRLGRLLSALAYNPSSIGVGLDEDTAAIIAPDDTIEIAGSGAITVVDPADVDYSSMDSANRADPVSIIGVRLHILVDGGRYNLRTREAFPGARK
ncbi:MAG: cyanophycinase [Planctomycetota bacterium]|nr:cyanophycinase [Planctomycetota bacterium]